MKAMMSIDGAAVEVDGEVAAECDDDTLCRLRDMIAARLRSQGLTLPQIGRVLNISGQHVGRICQAVPPWQLRRSREIIDEAVCATLG